MIFVRINKYLNRFPLNLFVTNVAYNARHVERSTLKIQAIRISNSLD